MVEYSLAKAEVEGSSPFFRLQNYVLRPLGFCSNMKGAEPGKRYALTPVCS